MLYQDKRKHFFFYNNSESSKGFLGGHATFNIQKHHSLIFIVNDKRQQSLLLQNIYSPLLSQQKLS